MTLVMNRLEMRDDSGNVTIGDDQGDDETEDLTWEMRRIFV